MTSLQGVNPTPATRTQYKHLRVGKEQQTPTEAGDHGLERMGVYQTTEPRVSFMSVFPVSDFRDSKCFEKHIKNHELTPTRDRTPWDVMNSSRRGFGMPAGNKNA